MAETYELNTTRRLLNRVMEPMIRWGMAPNRYYLLKVRGRKSGKPYTLPVAIVEYDHGRWLVAPYGEVSWVKNARSAGEVTLTRKGNSEMLVIDEVSAEAAAPILQAYVDQNSVVEPYFECRPEAPLSEFVAEAPRHPVFRLVEQPRAS